MALLGEQYEQTTVEMLQKQSVGHQAGACTTSQEKRRKMALLGEQYEQTMGEMLQKQSVSHQTGGFYCQLGKETQDGAAGGAV